MKKYKNFILYDGEQDFLYQMKCADIILLLHTLCKELCLDFQDFKEAFVETRISYKDIKSLERVLTNGWPPSFFQNNKKRENFLTATEKAFENCAHGKHPLRKSDFETVKKRYKCLVEDEMERSGEKHSRLRARLSLEMTLALRADPESFAKEEAEFQISQRHRAAKIFWNGIWKTIENENAGYERIEDETWTYYKIHEETCVHFFELLKNDPVIMKRLKRIFDEVDRADQGVDLTKRDTAT